MGEAPKEKAKDPDRKRAQARGGGAEAPAPDLPRIPEPEEPREPERRPVLMGEPVQEAIPAPEEEPEPPPPPIPREESPPEGTGPGEQGIRTIIELEGRMDHELKARLDREVEKETELKLEGEVEEGLEEKIKREMELGVESEARRQLGAAPERAPRIVDLSGKGEDSRTGRELLHFPEKEFLSRVPPERPPPGMPAPPPPPGPPPGWEPEAPPPPPRRLPPKRPKLKAARPFPGGEGMVNVRRNGAAEAAAGPGKDGLRNRRGLVNASAAANGEGQDGLRNRKGTVNGTGLSNGSGLVNGRRNGQGASRRVLTGRKAAVNGSLVDAEGVPNGRGIVNGRGIINGEGITNGRRMAISEAPPRRRKSAGWVVAAVVLAVVVAAIALYFGLTSMEKGIRIDGSFSDWSGVNKFPDDVADQANPEVNIVEYALEVDGSFASFYVRTEGRMLGGRDGGMDSVCLFLDTDQESGTGYRIDSVGAEFVLTVDGYDGRVTAAGLYRFSTNSGRPYNDWNSRVPVGSSRAAAAGNELEAQTSLQEMGLPGRAGMNLLVVARDNTGAADLAPVIGSGKAQLAVLWTRVGPASMDPGASGVEMMRMDLSARGSNATISGITVHLNPGVPDGDISTIELLSSTGYALPGASGRPGGGKVSIRLNPPLEVPASGTVGVGVRVSIAPGAAAGWALGLGLEGPGDILADTRAVTVESRSLQMTYIGSPSGQIVIDGAFGDWTGYPDHPDPSGDVPEPNVDVTSFKMASDASSFYFCLGVGGEMMGGTGIPEQKLRPPIGPGGPGGGPVTLPVAVGEDAFFLFVDADDRADTGYSGGGLPLGADFMVRITGQYGRIADHRVHRFTGGAERSAWSWSDGTAVPAANDETRLEAGIPLSALDGPGRNITVFYYATDWRQQRDAGESLAFDLGAGGGGRAAPGGGGMPEGNGEIPDSDGRDIQPLHAPEFRDALLPLAGTVTLFVLLRRRRARR